MRLMIGYVPYTFHLRTSSSGGRALALPCSDTPRAHTGGYDRFTARISRAHFPLCLPLYVVGAPSRAPCRVFFAYSCGQQTSFFTTPVFFFDQPFSTVGCHGPPRYCYYQPYDNDIIDIRNSKNNHARTRNTILSRRSFYHTTTRFFVLSLSPFCRFWSASGTTVSACHSAED